MISKRAESYSRALFELSSEEETLIQLKAFSQALTNPLLKSFFNSPLLSFKEKEEVLKDVLKTFSPVLKNFICILFLRNQQGLLEEICGMLAVLLNQKQGRLQGVLKSVKALPLEEQKQVEKKVERFLKKNVKLNQEQKKDSLGGFYVQVGDFIFNDQLEFHLRNFQNSGG